ncbi:MAG: hypothetical protein ACXADH_12800 [Candidatus Kariarchaeaceae archaeon]
MEKNKKRALRRFHNERMLRRSIRAIENNWYWSPEDRENDRRSGWIYKIARRRRDNMQVCSCSGCGNPRRSWGKREDRLTMPEIKAEDSYLDQIQEIFYVDPNDHRE